jgi:hypothetical protein
MSELNRASGMWATGVEVQSAPLGISTLFVPIGDNTTSFSGNFNGAGYTIDGLAINRPETDYVGLFGKVTGTTGLIQNVKLTNVSVTGKDYVGALIGSNEAMVDSVSVVAGLVSGTAGVGGLFARVGGLGGGNLIGGGATATCPPLLARLPFFFLYSCSARCLACSCACACIADQTLSFISFHNASCSSALANSINLIRYHQMFVTYLFAYAEQRCNYLAKPARNLLDALSIALSSSPASVALFTSSSADNKSRSFATSIANLPFANSSTRLP